MPDFAYTQHDTPAIRERIQRDHEAVLETLTTHDPRLVSLVLTGGFARAEGATRHGEPQNDYDFIALRRAGRPNRSYQHMRRQLEEDLGIHIDLAPIPTWRLRLAPRTIFWYETALRGRTLHGPDLLSRIRARDPTKLEATEGLRLLVNRAAGLLLVTEHATGRDKRLQASKGILAALDANLLAHRRYRPSQTERYQDWLRLRTSRTADFSFQTENDWVEWAYRYKVDPDHAPRANPDEAWRQAARILLGAVPTALQHANLPDLDAYARRDGLRDHLVYAWRAARIPGARRGILNPTGRVRAATLRLLEDSLHGRVDPDAAQIHLGAMAPATKEPLRVLDALRGATLQ